jgi:hypothetical protein
VEVGVVNRTNARCAAANLRAALLALTVLLSAGCAGTRPAAPPVPPPLQLLDAADLALPNDCVAAPGAVYRTLFEVQPDGRVSGPSSASGEGCVQQALRDWVATFSYAPTGAATPVAFDWMAVTASRLR